MHRFSFIVQIVLVALVFLFGSVQGNNWEPCPGDWIRYNDEKCFKIIDDSLRTFDEAKDVCSSQVQISTLVVIRSSEEQQFLSNYLFKAEQKLENFWIGAKFSVQNSSFIWGDNSPLNYTNWDTIPRNRSNYCVHLQADEAVVGKWKDGPCEKKNAVMCQRMQFWSQELLQKTFLDSRKEQRNALDTIRNLTQSLEMANIRVATQKESLQNAYQRIDAQKQSLENVSQRIDELKLNFENGISNANARINEQKQSLDNANARINEQKQSLDNANAKINEQKQSLDNANARINEQKQSLESANARINEQKQSLDNANARINEQKQSLESANARINEQKQSLDNANARINEQKQSLDNANARINEQKEGLANAHRRIDGEWQTNQNTHKRVNELQNSLVPVGFIYIQLAHQPEPRTLWPTIQWQDVTPTYAGVFFRAEGGGSKEFGAIQEENAPRVTQVAHEGNIHHLVGNNNWDSTTLNVGGWSTGLGVFSGHWKGSPGTTHKFLMSGGEIRPRNMAVRIWKREN